MKIPKIHKSWRLRMIFFTLFSSGLNLENCSSFHSAASTVSSRFKCFCLGVFWYRGCSRQQISPELWVTLLQLSGLSALKTRRPPANAPAWLQGVHTRGLWPHTAELHPPSTQHHLIYPLCNCRLKRVLHEDRDITSAGRQRRRKKRRHDEKEE